MSFHAATVEQVSSTGRDMTGRRLISRQTAIDSHDVVLDAADETAVLEFAQSVARGLSDTPPWLPCHYLYDARGSELFERITRQPEYYLTRTESAILAAYAEEIREATGPVTLIELGSGSSVKTDHLLAAYTRHGEVLRYVPVDVSESALRAAAAEIRDRYSDVDPTGIVGRYEAAFPQFREHSPCMVLFLGSTVGNLNRDEALLFWSDLADNLTPGDYVLLGADLVKDEAVLTAAYNDAAGVTAQFTTNLFRRINRELGANVDLEQIEHVARYNADWQRIDIAVRFASDQAVFLAPLDQTVTVSAGTEVMTEISRKFVLDDLANYLAAFGLQRRRAYTDEQALFAVLLLQREG